MDWRQSNEYMILNGKLNIIMKIMYKQVVMIWDAKPIIVKTVNVTDALVQLVLLLKDTHKI